MAPRCHGDGGSSPTRRSGRARSSTVRGPRLTYRVMAMERPRTRQRERSIENPPVSYHQVGKGSRAKRTRPAPFALGSLSSRRRSPRPPRRPRRALRIPRRGESGDPENVTAARTSRGNASGSGLPQYRRRTRRARPPPATRARTGAPLSPDPRPSIREGSASPARVSPSPAWLPLPVHLSDRRPSGCRGENLANRRESAGTAARNKIGRVAKAREPVSTVRRSVDELCVDTIRTLAIDAVQKAESGHPGLPLGAAPMAYVLWQKHLRHNPHDPEWPDRDRFVLSAGHGCMLLYCLLHLTGYDLTIDDLKSFRQWGSRTPGHPEWLLTPGVEATTGPSAREPPTPSAWRSPSAPGRAVQPARTRDRQSPDFRHPVRRRHDGRHFRRGVLAGRPPGSASSSLYDGNQVSLDGPPPCFTEDVGQRFEAYGWHVQHVADGNTDLDAIDKAIAQAKLEKNRPIDHHCPHHARVRVAEQSRHV